jgi:hypothetical protein
MKSLLTRLKRLESVRAVEQSPRPFEIEFAYLKLLPREYSGPRHRVKVGQRPDGRDEYEERPGEPPPNDAEDQDPTLLGEGTRRRRGNRLRDGFGRQEDRHAPS